MKITPSIQSDDLSLIPFSEEHLSSKYIEWLNTYNTVKYSELRHSTHTYDSCLNYYKKMVENKHYFWAIFHTPTNSHIGNMSAYLDHMNTIAELAILIGDQQFKGKGYGHKAWKMACDYLLLQDKFRKVTAGTMSINEPMKKIFHATGMEIEAIRKKHYIFNDQAVDIILAAKFSDSI